MKTYFLFGIIGLFAFIPYRLISQEQPDKRNVWTGGQKGYVVTGDLTMLKGQKTFNIIINPRIQKMGAAEEPDSVYISKRVKEWNEDKAGKGDNWLYEWKATKKNFKPAFIEGLNKKLSKYGVKVGPHDDWADYTFMIYTKNLMEFMNKIYVILDIDVVQTEDPTVKLASIRCPVNNSILQSEQFTSKYERAYYGAGYLFGRYLSKNVYKK